MARRSCIAALSVTSLLLAVLIIRTTGVAAVMERDLTRAAAAAPADTRVRLATALVLFYQHQGTASRESLSMALRVAPDAPLALEPVLISGAAAATAGENSRAEALLLEARRRDPRSALVRVHLLQLYAVKGRVAEASEELAVLARLLPRAAGELFIPQLAFYADDVAHREAYSRVLAAHPEVREALLLHLIAIGEDASLVMQLAGKSQPAMKQPEDDAWQMPLVERLIEAGELERSHRLWLQFTGLAEGGRHELVYDGSFKNALRPGPFAWKLSESGGGVAELGEKSGLYVKYYGREPAELARQTVVLSPGRYRLQMKVSGDVPAGVSSLGWRLRCLKSDVELLHFPLNRVLSAPRQINAQFVVPTGCRGQSLALMGAPPEFSKTENVAIHKIQVGRIP